MKKSIAVALFLACSADAQTRVRYSQISGAPVNARDAGALGDGLHDDTSNLQTAFTQACSTSRPLYIPAGIYKVSSTLTACGGIHVYGAGEFTSLLPTISDGSPVLNFPNGSTFFKVSNLRIVSSLNTANFDLGTATAQQCTGIRVQSGNPSGPFSSRFSLDNVHVVGVKVAYDIAGHILTANNVWAQFNEVGLQCSFDCNSFKLGLKLEDNRQDFAISSGSGIVFEQLLMEGANTLAVASTLDTVRGVTFISPYFEYGTGTPRSQPYLVVGGSTLVSDFKILGGFISGSGGFQTEVYPIKLDNCANCEINAHFEDGSQGRKVQTTPNTVDFKYSGDVAQGSWHTDASRQLSTAFNYFPNSSFEIWFRGWNDVAPTRSTFAQETTTVRRGANAVKISATAATNFNHTDFHLTGNVVTALRGKRVRFGVWMFVPNIAEYADASRTAFANIIAESFDGATVVTGSGSNTGAQRNAWNYLTAEVVVQATATRLGLDVQVNNSATNATGNEFVIIDDATLVEFAVPVSRQMIGDLTDSTLIPAVGVGGLMQAVGAAAPTDVNQVYIKGDVVWNNNVAAGGSPGWICTTGGSPGTWKTMATVAP